MVSTMHRVDVVDDMDIVDNHPNDIVIHYVVNEIVVNYLVGVKPVDIP